MYDDSSIFLLRFLIFIIGFMAFFTLGRLYPFRKESIKSSRLKSNILLTIINGLFFSIILKVSLFKYALILKNKNIGLFHFFNLSQTFNICLCIVLLDLIIYFQHRSFHIIPFFWKFHKVHHSDIFFDTTTALRFHPVEIFFSFFLKLLAILVFGFDPLGVVLFEIVLNLSAMFNHANFELRNSIDNLLRKIIVTPNFHRTHHSLHKEEVNSNYGFFLSIWDFLFKTSNLFNIESQDKMRIGLSLYRSEKDQKISSLLILPFRRKKNG